METIFSNQDIFYLLVIIALIWIAINNQLDKDYKKLKSKEYYGYALQLSDDAKLVECVVQYGSGNTIETSNLETVYFPYQPMIDIINDQQIDDEYIITPPLLFRVKITTEKNRIAYEFFSQEKTPEIVSLMKKPDYFKDIDINTLF